MTGRVNQVEKVMQNVLGVKWNKEEDCIIVDFALNINKRKKKKGISPDVIPEGLSSSDPCNLTKRDLLSQLNAVYDTLGLICPITIKGKFILRQLWAVVPKLEWDTPIPLEFRKQWFEFVEELAKSRSIVFGRCLKPALAVGDPILVLFSDFGKLGFTAAAYVGWKLKCGSNES